MLAETEFILEHSLVAPSTLWLEAGGFRCTELAKCAIAILLAAFELDLPHPLRQARCALTPVNNHEH